MGPNSIQRVARILMRQLVAIPLELRNVVPRRPTPPREWPADLIYGQVSGGSDSLMSQVAGNCRIARYSLPPNFALGIGAVRWWGLLAGLPW